MKTRLISSAKWKEREVAKALENSSDNFRALADLILDTNRFAVTLTIPGQPTRMSTFSHEEIVPLADRCAAQNRSFNRDEWFAYLENKNKLWIVNFGLGGIPSTRLVRLRQVAKDNEILDTGVDFMVQAETPKHAEELVTEWFARWQLFTTRLASPDVTEARKNANV